MAQALKQQQTLYYVEESNTSYTVSFSLISLKPDFRVQ